MKMFGIKKNEVSEQLRYYKIMNSVICTGQLILLEPG
jgi:hypothetical protein